MLEQKDFLDFVYVGAPRSGSTWLAAGLTEHPELWVPHQKEIHFFNDRLVYAFEHKYWRGLDFYRSYFKHAPASAKLGELSPFYYYDANAAYRIYKHFPQVRILVLLRNPVDLIYSLYLLLRRRERRSKTFEEEIKRNSYLLDLGFYHRLLTPYFDWFPSENIFVGIFEEFFADESESLKSVYSFLEVDETFKPSILGLRVNQATEKQPGVTSHVRGRIMEVMNNEYVLPVKHIIDKFRVNRIKQHVQAASAKNKEHGRRIFGPSEALRRELQEMYQPDISRLEKLLKRNLDCWIPT